MTHANQIVFVLCTVLTWSLFVSKVSLMSMLISLELLLFFLLCLIMYTMTPFFFSTTLLALLLCFATGGAAVGLTLLVSMSRLYGNDKIANLICEKVTRGSNITQVT